MPKIIRYNGNLKAFASEQLTNERTLFGQLEIANDLTSQYTPQFLRGWGIIGPSDQPSLQDFNGAMYTHGQVLAYLHQMGIAEYNNLQEYYVGSVTQIGGILYISLTNANIGNTPATSPAAWKAFIIPVQATATVPGIAAIATTAEATAGTNDTKLMTPLKVKQVIDSRISASTDGIAGSYSNLRISATGTSAPISVAADSVCVKTAAFGQQVLNAVSVTPSLAVSGVNGLDTGASAASTWYGVWIIWNGTTTAGLLSLSLTAPTMPAGYTHKALVGFVRTDATANKYPLSFQQSGRSWQYKVVAGSNVPSMPLLASGVGGNPSVGPTWATLAIGNFAPPSASEITLVLNTTVAGATAIIVAPNNAYGTYNSTTNPPPGGLANGSFLPGPAQARFMLEGTNIYWAADRAEARIYITSFGLNL